MDLAGKTAWVTGASSGIGEALAIGLAQRGARVILSGRREDQLRRVAATAGGETLVLPFEATEYDDLPAIVEEADNWNGGIEFLFNNAGISQRSLALDTSFDVYRRIMEVDFFAPVRLTQLVLPSMVERGSGHVVIISSVAGKVGVPLRTAYCAAKHACIGYFDALRAEIEKAYGVYVSVVTPGSVRTSVAVNALTGDGKLRGQSDEYIDNGMAPEKAAQIILDGIAAGAREIVVAEGSELGALQLRQANPEALFKITSAEGARLAAVRTTGAVPEPARFNAE